ncbi:hypothetical protein [Hymenobacter sp. PAMC 26628]|uniref:hypothetical protein n=1 Tax=Hymenobacter sp. PAMC 26628 TaxID=1484118 RepID=UPI001951ED6B|nr:hypothetical protein [Hymenobacter sp. PAMC 26628]
MNRLYALPICLLTLPLAVLGGTIKGRVVPAPASHQWEPRCTCAAPAAAAHFSDRADVNYVPLNQ